MLVGSLPGCPNKGNKNNIFHDNLLNVINEVFLSILSLINTVPAQTRCRMQTRTGNSEAFCLVNCEGSEREFLQDDELEKKLFLSVKVLICARNKTF